MFEPERAEHNWQRVHGEPQDGGRGHAAPGKLAEPVPVEDGNEGGEGGNAGA
jgi:hypothetical protein